MCGARHGKRGRVWRAMAYICYIAIGFLIGMAVGILGLLVWNSLGAAQMASRQCTLQNLRAELERRAESEGRYPRDLRDVIEELGLGKHVDADDLGYPAAGRAYDLREDDMVLFYERRARRYGFVVGRFEMRQSYFNFRLGVEGQVRRE